MSDLKVGDIARLKSGGPMMTVSGLFTGVFLGTPAPTIECMWFDADDNLHKGTFAVEALKVGG